MTGLRAEKDKAHRSPVGRPCQSIEVERGTGPIVKVLARFVRGIASLFSGSTSSGTRAQAGVALFTRVLAIRKRRRRRWPGDGRIESLHVCVDCLFDVVYRVDRS